MKRYVIALLVALCLSNFKTSWAASLTGQVFAVKTGNLISLSLASGELRGVRLIGITPPPPRTATERISKRHLHMLLAGKFISIVYQTLTPSGEILGQVMHGGSDINLRMLEAGLAQVNPYDSLAPKTLLQYQKAQRQAQIRRLGIWRNTRR